MRRGVDPNDVRRGLRRKSGAQEYDNQPVSGAGDMTTPTDLPTSPSFLTQQSPLQQYMLNMSAGQVQGITLQGTAQTLNVPTQNIGLTTGQHNRPYHLGQLTAQTTPTSPPAGTFQQQLSPQAQALTSRHLGQTSPNFTMHPQITTTTSIQQSPPASIALTQLHLQHQTQQQQRVNAMLNIPISPTRALIDPSSLAMRQMSVSPASSGHNQFVFQDARKMFPDGELQLSRERIPTQPLPSPAQQPAGTIHHHGSGQSHSPSRSTVPSLSSPGLSPTQNVHSIQGLHLGGQVTSQRRSSTGYSPTNRTGFDRTSPISGSGYLMQTSPVRSSPNQSPVVMRKTQPKSVEEKPPANSEVAQLRKTVFEHKENELRTLKENYNERLMELFFLQTGGNMMDYHNWKKRPTPQLVKFLKAQNLDGDSEEEEQTINDEVKVITNVGSNMPVGTPVAISTQLPPAASVLSQQLEQQQQQQQAQFQAVTGVAQLQHSLPQQAQLKISQGATVTPVQNAVPLRTPQPVQQQQQQQPVTPINPASVLSSSASTGQVQQQQQQQQQALKPLLNKVESVQTQAVETMTCVTTATTTTTLAATTAVTATTTSIAGPLSVSTTATTSAATSSVQPTTKLPKSPLSPTSHQRLLTRQHSISAVYDYTIGSQEEIVERAKQEAQVMQRIAQLRKEGLWSARRLPRVQEPPRCKTQWDFLLEEMQWLANDFLQERKWKKNAAKKLSRSVAKFFSEQRKKEDSAEKEEVQKLKRIASTISKEIKQFWANIEKVVQYKQQTRLEEKRKKALDLHLNYIVGQTEKYSSWLTEGLTQGSLSAHGSGQGSVASSPSRSASDVGVDDADFEPAQEESDDEETIDVEEQQEDKEDQEKDQEIELLQKESEVPIEELLKKLPPEILEKPASIQESSDEDSDDKDDKNEEDDEFVPTDEEGNDQVFDEEDTIEEQEKQEGDVNHKEELDDLNVEGEMSMEELIKKYAGAYDEDFDVPTVSDDESEEDSIIESQSESQSEESESEDEGSVDEEGELVDIGMEYLINPDKENDEPSESKVDSDGKGPNKEITDIAAAAQSIQPTGYTLSTTQVKTLVPFLLRHKLREYQHIGLDWLVTMHLSKLNGILADEMGLGKTIQTIALLAHLAEQGNWGPHLIVVPTSVMLNWEMEFKKWCPGFKILTYYGNQKERKQKRQGWTKTNAFHVCITSYKLVLQDHQSFRRKKWKYLVLDEAQNIKNFKSQRWQTLLNFNSQRRLLLTGTPLQNNLMELWSLMHFLMPHVFHSHREFREWFSNPVSGMIEGSQEYNENLIKRLHKVLRPFLLRRLKKEVETQLPSKYEHVIKCRLSKRQRFLYDDFMSRAKTKETLASGHFMSVINILMQLRKVCNHPDLFESRPILSPFHMEGICFYTASLILEALDYDPFKHVDLRSLNLCLADLELTLPAFAAHRVRKLRTPRPLIEEIDSTPEPPPRPPKMKIKPGRLFTLSPSPKEGRTSPFVPIPSPVSQVKASPTARSSPVTVQPRSPSTPPVTIAIVTPTKGLSASPLTIASQASPVGIVSSGHPVTSVAVLPQVVSAASVSTTQSSQLPGYTLGVLQQGKLLVQTSSATTAGVRPQLVSSQPITVQIGQQGTTRLAVTSGQLRQLPQGGFVQIVQTTAGQQILRPTPLTPSQQSTIVQAVIQTQTQTVAQQKSPLVTPVVIGSQIQQQQQRPQQAAVSSVASAQTATITLTGTTPASGRPATVVVTPAQTIPGSGAVRSASPTDANANEALRKESQETAACQRMPPLAPIRLSSNMPTKLQPVVKIVPLHIAAGKVINKDSVTISAPKTTPTTMTYTAISTPKKNVETQKPAVTATPATVKVKTEDKVPAEAPKSPLYLESIESKRKQDRRDTLERIARFNEYRCNAAPVYGRDLFQAVSILNDTSPHRPNVNMWKGAGLINCYNIHHNSNVNHPKVYWSQTESLRSMVRTPDRILDDLKEIIDRFVIVVPPTEAPPITMHTSHTPPSILHKTALLRQELHREMMPRTHLLSPIESVMKTHFPERRLIQYDCGKLQVLDKLLRDLKYEGHKVLIFTQMTRMLDVLEQFLNYHGYTYLRLDGTTRVEMRQALMERFNADKRIFVFILSTRSGGIGVNLTGADTVIFYDSDWNPTMDAQAQDRCHRIGQTRDVHIYRLISEKTVEENILKKANQKRMLVNVSIEGGNFTTAFFKHNSIRDLFDTSLASQKEEKSAVVSIDKDTQEKITQAQLEQALAKAEDEADVRATTIAQAEQKAELAEFDETIPIDGEDSQQATEEASKVEEELAQLEDQLMPVERYAVSFLESSMDPIAAEQLKVAEEQVEAAKKDWELGRLQKLKEEEERRAEMEEDEVLFTFSREDAYNQVHKQKKKSRESSCRGSHSSNRSSGSQRLKAGKSGQGSSDNSPKTATTRSRVVENGPRTPKISPQYNTRHSKDGGGYNTRKSSEGEQNSSKGNMIDGPVKSKSRHSSASNVESPLTTSRSGSRASSPIKQMASPERPTRQRRSSRLSSDDLASSGGSNLFQPLRETS